MYWFPISIGLLTVEQLQALCAPESEKLNNYTPLELFVKMQTINYTAKL